MIPDGFTVIESPYTYSDPVTIRTWNGGSLAVKVGYVREHPEKNQIVLEKTVNGQSKPELFYIRDAKDWNDICSAVNGLWPELTSTKSGDQIKEAVKHVVEDQKLLGLIAKFPNLLTTLPKDTDLLSLPEEHKEALRQLLAASGEIASAAINRLAQEKPADIAEFVEILKEFRLTTINSLITSITTKIAFIDKFEKVVNDTSSYERQGDDSVHNLLKANIWILDQNFVILHEDTTINQILAATGGQKVNGSEGSTRPDFLCLVEQNDEAGNRRIVIIEIKRPGIKIGLEHVKQALGYKVLLQSRSGTPIEKYEVFLIGSEIDPILQQHPLTRSDVTAWTYTDFISRSKKFYREYLDIIKKNPLSV